MKLGIALALAAALVACQTPGPVVPAPDASDASARADAPAPPPGVCEAACASLVTAHCSEGSAPDCAAALSAAEQLRLIRTPSGAPLTCAGLVGVTTAAQAKAGGVACDP